MGPKPAESTGRSQLAAPHGGGGLAWHRAYRKLSHLRSALWVAPIVAMLAELLAISVLRVLDRYVPWDLTGLTTSGAQTLFQTIITLTLSFIIFTFGSLLVAVQIAGGQLTPRIIATTLLSDRVIKYTVGLHVFTMLFAISALNRLSDQVSQIVTLTAVILGLTCLGTFLFLIDYAARLLRPVRILTLVCEDGLDVIRGVYPDSAGSQGAAARPRWRDELGPPARTVLRTGTSQVVLGVDVAHLEAEARRFGGAIEFVPQVGDFVSTGEPLFRLYGGAAAIDDRWFRLAVAFGPERTMEQDPMFAVRIIVDIALKALSPAINDPTTAVLAIDQLQRLLRFVGARRLHDDTVVDADGEIRVILRTPNWDDFVQTACNEIRICGANNVQIARRQRAMLENLMLTLPPGRHAALQRELDILDRVLPGLYSQPEDIALARVADTQGLGGAAQPHQASSVAK